MKKPKNTLKTRPKNSQNAEEDLFLADAKNFALDGEVHIFTKNGTLKRKFTVQRGPGAIAFNRQP